MKSQALLRGWLVTLVPELIKYLVSFFAVLKVVLLASPTAVYGELNAGDHSGQVAG